MISRPIGRTADAPTASTTSSRLSRPSRLSRLLRLLRLSRVTSAASVNMYSLYRAWLSMSHHQPPPGSSTSTATTALIPLNLSAPAPIGQRDPQDIQLPDVQLQVGPGLTNFSAHRNVLQAHSGFFKAALTNGSGPILVPNIQVDEFSSLLTFMYTGYLDLNLGNIYNILLATHILHMPRALELCRNYLMHTQPQQQQILTQPSPPTTTTSIIKPIASRKPLPNIAQFQNPQQHVHNEETKGPNKKTKDEAHSGATVAPPIFTNIESSVFKKLKQQQNEMAPPPPEASTSSKEPSSAKIETSPSPSLKQKKDVTISTSDGKTKTNKGTKRRHNTTMSAGSMATQSAPTQDDRVIVDIACCDGPVRFHRVINKNYGGQSQPTKSATSDSVENQTETMMPKGKSKRSVITEQAMNKVMSENIKMADTTTVGGANGKLHQNEENTIASNSNSGNSNSGDVYTCLYCNHTFKSQYCYQKHARRHLNPVNDTPAATPSAGGDCHQRDGNHGAGSGQQNKREFKLLDMNVQYYPCKTCGSKFPSYYFVHKHRKLCHADEMADGNNKNNEIVQVKPPNVAGETTSGETDVEIEDVDDEVVVVGKRIIDGASCDNSNSTSHHSDIIDVEETNDD